MVELGIARDLRTQQVEDHAPLRGFLVRVEGRDLARLLELHTLVQQHGGIATIVDDQIGATTVGPLQGLPGAPPVFLEGLTLPGEDRSAEGLLHRAVLAHHHRGRGVILGGEDVAAHPAHVRSEIAQGLDEHGGLHGHVQASHDLRTRQGLLLAETPTQRHETWHLVLGEFDLPPSELGQGEVGNFVGGTVLHRGRHAILPIVQRRGDARMDSPAGRKWTRRIRRTNGNAGRVQRPA